MISTKVSKNTDSKNCLAYACKEGMFTAFDDNGNISYGYSCREQFAAVFHEGTKAIGFYYAGMDIKAINHFFEEFVDARLEINSVILHLSTINNLLVIEVDEFWRKDFIRRSLFTLLLRCAVVFNRNTLNESLDAYYLAKDVKEAVNHFLDGNIFLSKTFDKWQIGNGFVSEFKGRPNTELRDKMSFMEVKPAEHFLQTN